MMLDGCLKPHCSEHSVCMCTAAANQFIKHIHKLRCARQNMWARRRTGMMDCGSIQLGAVVVTH